MIRDQTMRNWNVEPEALRATEEAYPHNEHCVILICSAGCLQFLKQRHIIQL